MALPSGVGSGAAAVSAASDATGTMTTAAAPETPLGLYDIPPIWGHVLDYLPRATMDVALSAVVDDDTREEVERSITALNLTEGRQLDAPSTGGGRFPNVEEINCLSFLLVRAAEDSPPDARRLLRKHAVCRETAARLVPFLATFPQLRQLYVGGVFVELDEDGNERLFREEYRYSSGACCTFDSRIRRLQNTANLNLVSSFGYQFIGAMKARVFPSLESTESISSLLQHTLCPDNVRQSHDAKDMCAGCRDICAYFPLKDVVNDVWESNCVEQVVVFEAVAARDGAKRLLSHLDSWCSMWMRDAVYDMFRLIIVGNSTDTGKMELRDIDRLLELRDRLQRLGADGSGGDVIVEYLERDSCAFIDRMIAVGWCPDTLQDSYFDGYFDKCPIAKTAFDFLVSRGFPLKNSNCIVVDEKTEPALRELIECFDL